MSLRDSKVITVVCARCKVIHEVPGTPETYETVFATAKDLGWMVVDGRYCYCPPCTAELEKEGPS